MIDDAAAPADQQGSSRDGPCTLRRATLADRDAVVALVFETLRSFGIEPEPEGIDADAMQFGVQGDARLSEFVAEISGTLVGSIALRDRGDCTGHISKLFVDARARGHGIGKRLLNIAVADARRRKLRQLDLETRGELKAAIHLYESTGWVRGPDPNNVCDRSYLLRL